MRTRSRRRRGPHTHGNGSAIRESEGRPQGIASGGLLRSPFEHHAAPPSELVSEEWAASFDWFSFVCTSCGQDTYVTRDWSQCVADFYLMCTWIYGVKPVCSACQAVARVC